MSNTNEKIQNLWEELIVKEKMDIIIAKLNKIEKEQNQLRQIIKDELTNLWNVSEIPTFRIILEKLTKLEEVKNKQKLEKEELQQPEIKPINIWKRTKEPIMVDISKNKPKISKSVEKMLDGLLTLQKEKKF